MDPMGLSCTSSLVERRSLHGNSLPTELWGASRTSSESTGRDGVFRVFFWGVECVGEMVQRVDLDGLFS